MCQKSAVLLSQMCQFGNTNQVLFVRLVVNTYWPFTCYLGTLFRSFTITLYKIVSERCFDDLPLLRAGSRSAGDLQRHTV